jgi:hypothetical protein
MLGRSKFVRNGGTTSPQPISVPGRRRVLLSLSTGMLVAFIAKVGHHHAVWRAEDYWQTIGPWCLEVACSDN